VAPTPISTLLDQLADQGWAWSDTLFPSADCTRLLDDARQLWNQGVFHDAGIGRGLNHTRNDAIRGDAIYWLKSTDTRPAIQRFRQWAALLQQTLNQDLFLGLNNAEFHFARYPAGSGYIKHRDQHRDQTARRISLVLYLNTHWLPADGGELVIYDPVDDSRPLQRLLPTFGRLVLFRSDLVPHEVAACGRTRWSLTGWFRTDHGVF
jgi:SM-20-related protein